MYLIDLRKLLLEYAFSIIPKICYELIIDIYISGKVKAGIEVT